MGDNTKDEIVLTDAKGKSVYIIHNPYGGKIHICTDEIMPGFMWFSRYQARELDRFLRGFRLFGSLRIVLNDRRVESVTLEPMWSDERAQAIAAATRLMDCFIHKEDRENKKDEVAMARVVEQQKKRRAAVMAIIQRFNVAAVDSLYRSQLQDFIAACEEAKRQGGQP